MSVTGINHFNFRADRKLLDDLLNFYVAVVGLVPGARPPFKSFGYWLYAGGRDVLHLTESASNEERLKNVASTIDHVAFTCSDIQAATARLQKHNVPYTDSKVPLTGAHQLFFRDPAGNGVELNCPRNAGLAN